jgi:hypothetical protein
MMVFLNKFLKINIKKIIENYSNKEKYGINIGKWKT